MHCRRWRHLIISAFVSTHNIIVGIIISVCLRTTLSHCCLLLVQLVSVTIVHTSYNTYLLLMYRMLFWVVLCSSDTPSNTSKLVLVPFCHGKGPHASCSRSAGMQENASNTHLVYGLIYPVPNYKNCCTTNFTNLDI